MKPALRYRFSVVFCAFFAAFASSSFFSGATQLSGSYTIDPSGTASSTLFNDFGSAITYMTSTGSRADGGPSNSGTVGVSGAVTFNVTSGTTYTLSSALVVPGISGASSSNTITFKKNGSSANPIIYGYKGSGSQDGIVIFLGASYITFDGIDVTDPSSNTTTNAMMEWGYALLRSSTPAGSQYNVIKNCKITLNRTNTNSVGVFGDCYTWSSGSLTSVTPSSSSGATSYNGIYSNTITNCFTPIYIRGYQSGSSYVDQGNDIGSKGGNTISSFGNGANSSPYTNPYTSAVVNGIFLYQQGDTYYISNNTITLTASDNVSVIVNAISSVAWGVAVTGSNPTIKGNIINIVSTSTGSAFTGIANNQGTGNSVEDIENNIITGVNTTATGAANFIGINIQSTIPKGKYIIDGNEIKNCVVYGTGYFYGISTTGGGNPTSPFSFSNNKIHDNTKTSGSSGDMYLIHYPIGTVALTQAGNQIYNNTCNTGNLYGIYNTAGTSTEDIHGNLIYNLSSTSSGTIAGIYSNNTCTSRKVYGDSVASLTPGSSGSAVGIYQNGGSAVNVYKNKVYMPGGGLAGIFMNKVAGSASVSNYVANNFVTLGGTSALSFCIFENGGSNYSYYYNSLLCTNTNSNSGCFFISNTSSSANMSFNNNSGSNTGGGYAMYMGSSSGISMDYNNWYATGSYLANYGGSTNIAKLASWQSASKLDAHSWSVNPQYKSAVDLHLRAKLLARAGNSVKAVTDDIDGKPRHPAPTIGANEISPFKTDIGISAILSPVYGACGDSFMAISANLTNFGTDSQKNITVTAVLSGPTGSGTYTATSKPYLLYDSTVTMTFGTTINSSAGGTWRLKVYTSLSGDSDRTNDSINTLITLYSHSPQPKVTANALCHPGYTKLAAKAVFAADSIYWYNNASASSLAASGDTLKTPFLTGTTTWYAQERLPAHKYSIGAKSTAIGSTATGMGITGFKFNALTTITIDSGTIYPAASGSVMVTLLDSTGRLMRSASIPVSVSSSGSAVRIPIGLVVSKGNGYYLTINDSGTGGLTYNTSGTAYPYSVSAVASITAPYKGSSTYDGFYNLVLHTGNCGSTLVPVTASLATPNVSLGNDFASFGKLYGGTAANPDRVCAGSAMVYDLVTSLNNSDYGTKWTVTAKSLITPKGTVSKDTAWSKPTSTSPGKFTFTSKTGTADSMYILKITVKKLDALGCDSTYLRYLYVSPLPTPKFGIKNACLGSAVAFTDSSKVSTGTVAQWSWDYGDAVTGTQQNPAHTYSKAGKFNVTLKAITDYGCSATLTKTAEEYPFPKANFTNTPGCQLYASTFKDTSTIPSGSITGWKWTFGDGNTGTGAKTTNTYVKSGYYNVKLVAASAVGCKDSITQKIRIMPKPKAAWSYNNACVGAQIYFANTSFDSATGTAYLWNFADGKTSASEAPSHIYTANGTYPVKLTVTSKAGCVDTLVQNITPYAKPTARFVHTPGCTGRNITFTDSGHNGSNTLYAWDFGDKATATNKLLSTTHAYSKAGSYHVSILVTANSGCTDTTSATVLVTDFPKPAFTANDVCLGQTTAFANTTTPATGNSYEWTYGDGTAKSTAAAPTHKYTKTGAYTVKLAATNGNGCADTATKTVNVNAPPVVTKWRDEIHNFTVRFVPADTTEKGYKWYFGTGDSGSDKKPVYTYPTSAGKYTVKLVVTNSSGCSASLTDSLVLDGTGINATQPNPYQATLYPNPVAGAATLSYTLPHAATTAISITDLQGRETVLLPAAHQPAGTYKQAVNAGEMHLVPGIYLVKMMVDEEVWVGRLIVE